MFKRTGALPGGPPLRQLAGCVVRDVGDLVDADLPASEVEMLALAASLVDPDRPYVQVVV